ncbi:hypothetical protein ACFW96_28995 [Streptomyces gardneri]
MGPRSEPGLGSEPSCTGYDGQMVVVGTTGQNRPMEAIELAVRR